MAAKRPAKKSTARKRPAKKAPAKKVATKRAPARKKAPAKKKTAARRSSTMRRTAAPRDLHAVRPVGFAGDREFWGERCRTTVSGDVTVHCGDLTAPVLDFISDATSIIGCVAWITSRDILGALARVPGGVALCIQKERNLRPGGDQWSTELRRRYLELPRLLPRAAMPAPLCNTDGPKLLDPVRCVGWIGGMHSPLMHHKLLVAGRLDGKVWVPERVWTGSFNLTSNAASSAENAVVIDDPVAAGAYLAEFARVGAISESLAWTSRVAKPELRRRAAS